MYDFDCVIIGAGVAGMTSAIYLKRYSINVLLLEKSSPGGQITKTPKIENYPGFVSIDGSALAMNILDQINHLHIPYQYGNVIKIENKGDLKIVYTETEQIHTKTIIIATGRKPRKLGIKKENQLIGKGISWCATCDGMFYKEQNVAVVGGGNSALEEALFLSTICKNVYILYRGEKLRADHILQEKVSKIKNIEIYYVTEVKELIEKNSHLDGIVILKNQIEEKLNIQGLFIYIGFEPSIELFESLNIQLDQNYIVTNEKMETSIKGIYACGDIRKKDLYQITTAIGEASIAAYHISQNLIK